MEDFEGKSLYRRTGHNHLHLHVHRKEIVKRPATSTRPLFPLKKYFQSNYTVEGLEKKRVGDHGEPLAHPDDEPPFLQQSDLDKTSEIAELCEDGLGYEDLHNVLSDGDIVQTDPLSGRWRRRRARINKIAYRRRS